ncbi:MAG: M20 family metallopeptidase [Acidimicrobiales bacterium]
MSDIAAAKERLVEAVDQRADVLIDTSHEIHAHPELGFEEHFAADRLTGILEAEGLTVERAAYGLDTAFAARAGDSGPLIAVMCEYDALPGLGHACGHNIIATAGLGAGLAAAALAGELGGRVLVLGTPAEEGGGGKAIMAANGALAGVDAAMMVHPAGADLTAMSVIAVQRVFATYSGEAAHAAAFPQKGRNALDAMVLGYQAVAALRQHIRPDERIHGIFLEAGDKGNIVPARTRAEWYVRSPRDSTLAVLKERVATCLEAGATAAGCTVEFEWVEPRYLDMLDNGPMVECYAANAATLGRTVVEPTRSLAPVVGSTDMGNVSHEVPSIHPMIKVSPPHVPIHSEEFVRWARSDDGDRAVLDGAKALAMTVADLWLRPEVLDAARDAFRAELAATDGSTEGSPSRA